MSQIFVTFVKFFKKNKNTQYSIYENLLKSIFLEKFIQNLYPDLYNLRKKDAHLTCCLIKKIFNNEHGDWFDGSTRKFNVSQAFKIFEDYEINKIKKNNCKVVLDKL